MEALGNPAQAPVGAHSFELLVFLSLTASFHAARNMQPGVRTLGSAQMHALGNGFERKRRLFAQPRAYLQLGRITLAADQQVGFLPTQPSRRNALSPSWSACSERLCSIRLFELLPASSGIL